MKTKDLMIGDYVTFKDCQNDDAPTIVKIEGLGYQERGGVDEAIVSIDGDAAFDLVEINEEFVGIPLTPEILEKKGLSKLVTYGTEKWVCDKFRLNEYDNKGVWRFCAYTNRNEDSVIYIRYVHELQHALKLCGIEKEITF